MKLSRLAAVFLVVSLPSFASNLPSPPPGEGRQAALGVDRKELNAQLDELSRSLERLALEKSPRKRLALARKMEEQISWMRSGTRRPRWSGAPAVATVNRPVEEGALNDVCKALSQEPFSRDKLRLVSELAPTRYFLVTQVERILGQFEFSNDRLEAARILRPRILDPENHFKLYSAFEFSSDKDRLRQILSET